MHATTFSVALARRLNSVKVNGKTKRMYRFPVRVETAYPQSHFLWDTSTVQFTVIASTAAEAANWVRDTCELEPWTTITVRGPRGGDTVRFVGYESWTWREMMAHHSRWDQMDLPGIPRG